MPSAGGGLVPQREASRATMECGHREKHPFVGCFLPASFAGYLKWLPILDTLLPKYIMANLRSIVANPRYTAVCIYLIPKGAEHCYPKLQMGTLRPAAPFPIGSPAAETDSIKGSAAHMHTPPTLADERQERSCTRVSW